MWWTGRRIPGETISYSDALNFLREVGRLRASPIYENLTRIKIKALTKSKEEEIKQEKKQIDGPPEKLQPRSSGV